MPTTAPELCCRVGTILEEAATNLGAVSLASTDCINPLMPTLTALMFSNDRRRSIAPNSNCFALLGRTAAYGRLLTDKNVSRLPTLTCLSQFSVRLAGRSCKRPLAEFVEKMGIL